MSQTQLDQVMSNPLYNPTRDPNVTRLYQTMLGSDISEDLIEQYRQIVRSGPTANPYKGLIFNPRACEIDLATSILEEIKDHVKDRYLEVVRDGTPTDTYTPNPAQVLDYTHWQRDYPQIEKDLEYIGDGLDDFKDHTDRAVANFPTIIGATQTDIGNNNNSTQVPTFPGGPSTPGGGNPCLQFGDMLGSLLEPGRLIMDMILGAMQQLLNAAMGAIQGLIDQIMGAIMGVMGAIQQMISMMLGEITAMAMALLNMARMALAQLMAFIPSDPCLNSILGGMITSAAQGIMGNIAGGLVGGLTGGLQQGIGAVTGGLQQTFTGGGRLF